MAVQISGNDITVPRDTTVTRNLTVGGVLTYEDVTNVDSVGLVTARSGLEIGARPGVAASISVDGNMIISGISTFGDDITFTGATSGRDVVFDTSLNQIRAQDNAKLCAGSSSDLEIYHTGSASYIDNYTGALYLRNNVSSDVNGDIYIQAKSGENSVVCYDDGAVELYHDGTKMLETTSIGLTISGDVKIIDNENLRLGTDNDMLLYHTGSHGYIENATGNMYIRGGGNQILMRANSSEDGIVIKPDGAVELYHNNEKKLYTYGEGVYVQDDSGASVYVVLVSNAGAQGSLYGTANTLGLLDGQNHYMLKAIKDGGVELYYDNAITMKTITDGIQLQTNKVITRHPNSDTAIIHVTNAQYAKSLYIGGWDGGTNSSGIARVRNSNDNLHIDSGSAGITYINAYCTGATFIRDLWPLSNDAYDLGREANKWDDVYATNGTIQTSDKNQKNTIIESDLGLSFVNKLKPVSYKFNGKTRTHYGLIAQDVETVLSDISKSTTDFAGFIKTDLPDEYYQEAEPHIPEGKKEGDLKSAAHTEYGLRYTEFISPLIKAVQELSAENTALKARLDAAGL